MRTTTKKCESDVEGGSSNDTSCNTGYRVLVRVLRWQYVVGVIAYWLLMCVSDTSVVL